MVYDNRRSPVGLRLFYAADSGEAASLPPGVVLRAANLK